MISMEPWLQARWTGVERSCCWMEILAPDFIQSSTACGNKFQQFCQNWKEYFFKLGIHNSKIERRKLHLKSFEFACALFNINGEWKKPFSGGPWTQLSFSAWLAGDFHSGNQIEAVPPTGPFNLNSIKSRAETIQINLLHYEPLHAAPKEPRHVAILQLCHSLFFASFC